jgi:hypothetical protein
LILSRSNLGLLELPLGLLGRGLGVFAIVVMVSTNLLAQTTPKTSTGLLFDPKLHHYPLKCQDLRGCRIDCFQNGVNIATLTGISQQDEARLVVNVGISDEITPRWIEITPFNGSEPRTLLLSRDTFCDLKAFIIHPTHQP